MKTLLSVAAIAAIGLVGWLAWRWPGRPVDVPAMASAEAQADLVEVFKGERRLELRRNGSLLKTYRVALGFAPEQHKEREGDGRTPEGGYTIDARNPKSSFHLSLRVSYPDDKDKVHATSLGVPPAATSISMVNPTDCASCW